MSRDAWRSRPRIGRRSPLRGLLARPWADVQPRGPAEEYHWQRVLEAEWARLFARAGILFGRNND